VGGRQLRADRATGVRFRVEAKFISISVRETLKLYVLEKFEYDGAGGWFGGVQIMSVLFVKDRVNFAEYTSPYRRNVGMEKNVIEATTNE